MLISKFSEIRHVFLDYLSVSDNYDNTNKKNGKVNLDTVGNTEVNSNAAEKNSNRTTTHLCQNA